MTAEEKLYAERKLYLSALCEKLGEWYPQFKFDIINPHFMWMSVSGKYLSDLSPLSELGIYPKNEKAWARDYTTWDFRVTQEVGNKIANKIKST